MSDLGRGLAGLEHHLHRFGLELRAEPSPLLWHGQILSSSESLSEIVGAPQGATAPYSGFLRPSENDSSNTQYGLARPSLAIVSVGQSFAEGLVGGGAASSASERAKLSRIVEGWNRAADLHRVRIGSPGV